MSVVEKVVLAVVAMNGAEREALWRRLEEEGAGPPAPSAGEAEKGGKRARGRRPYWLKMMDGFNDGKKGGYAIQGEPVWKAGELEDGRLLAIGVRSEPKAYGLLRVSKGESYVREVNGLTLDVKDVVEVFAPSGWGAFSEAAKGVGE